ncbi:PASTA domain-containing protein [Persicobacter psychrovividus]|uniref:PASTA domain-containing protein n=1 Tax=Persicobacter psychrovividus TaxID=387638 RepID=A0ABN6L6S0_9BACT|nr:hypothetical protein PEPS_11750 [Persicobacter psychrovividus]
MSFFKPKSFLDILLHWVVLGALGSALLIGYFYYYLPNITEHGQTVTVPNVVERNFSDLKTELSARSLRFEVDADSGFSADLPPLAVIKQFPEPGTKVKSDRKIYLTLNAMNPPKVPMPNLVDGSLTNAQIVLNSLKLKMGEITYEPDLAENAVLKQEYKGSPVEAGTLIAKGSTIDLVVGDGYGKRTFEVEDYVGRPLDEVELAIKGASLKVGNIKPRERYDSLDYVVQQQRPAENEKVHVGQEIDLWVTPVVEQADSVSTF